MLATIWRLIREFATGVTGQRTERQPRFSAAFPILAVTDVAASRAFYQELLCFALAHRWPDEGKVEFASLPLGRSGLGIARRGQRHGQTGAAFATGGVQAVDICLDVGDPDRALAWRAHNGVPVLIQPVTPPRGERTASVVDPDGLQPLLIESPATG